MVQTTQTTNTVLPSRLPDNYMSDFSAIPGAFAGFMGSVIIIAIIGALALATGQDIWLSPRLIASTLLGEGAATGAFPIILGTIMHLSIGVVYGAFFGLITPTMPRALWIVAGIIYGVAIWGIAAVLIPLLSPFDTATTAYFSALIIANVIFGITLGIAATFYGFRKSIRTE